MAWLTKAAIDDGEAMKARQHYDRLWQEARAKFEKAERYYRLDYPVWDRQELVDARSNYRPSTARSIIDHAVDQQTVLVPKVHCYEGGDSKTHRERAALKEKFGVAVLTDCALMEPGLLWKRFAKHLNLYGVAVGEGPFLALDDMPQEPERGTDEPEALFKARLLAWKNNRVNFNPFRLHAPNPAWVLTDPWALHHRFSFKTYQVASAELEEMVRKKKWQADVGAAKRVYADPQVTDDPTAPVTVTELWTEYWHEVYQNETRLYSEINIGGFVPTVLAYTDLGMEYSSAGGGQASQTSVSSVMRNPADLCVSLLEPIFDVILMHTQLVNAANNASVESSYPQLFTPNDPNVLASQRRAGAIGEADKDTVWWLGHPGLAPFVEAVDAAFLQDIQQGTFNLQAAGFKEAGVDTATQQIILTNAASKKFLSVNKQLERMATIMLSRIFRLVEVLGMTLTIQGVTITPEDIDGLYDCRVSFESVDPVVESQRKVVAQAEVAAGLMAPQTYYARFGGEDWEGEQDRLMEDRLRKTPLMQAVKMASIARKLGEIEVADALDMKAKELRQQAILAIQQGGGMLNPLLGGPPDQGAGPMQPGQATPHAPPQSMNGQSLVGVPGG